MGPVRTTPMLGAFLVLLALPLSVASGLAPQPDLDLDSCSVPVNLTGANSCGFSCTAGDQLHVDGVGLVSVSASCSGVLVSCTATALSLLQCSAMSSASVPASSGSGACTVSGTGRGECSSS